MPDSPRLPSARLRALVAAPDPADVGSIASALGAAGHEIVTAYRVETAVARLVEDQPDYVVICLPARSPDVTMLIARLHARSDAPILVVTDTRDEERVVAALDAGAADVVPAPVRQLELLARVQAALRKRPPATTSIGGNLDGLEVDGGRHEARVAGQMGDDAQLDLVVVGDQEPASPRRDEAPPEAPALVAAHRDVVQVGLIG